jgi:hypothetical protein
VSLFFRMSDILSSLYQLYSGKPRAGIQANGMLHSLKFRYFVFSDEGSWMLHQPGNFCWSQLRPVSQRNPFLPSVCLFWKIAYCFHHHHPLFILTVAQLIKKFPAFNETRRFITLFTRACHRPLSGAWSKQNMNFQKITLTIIIKVTCSVE